MIKKIQAKPETQKTATWKKGVHHNKSKLAWIFKSVFLQCYEADTDIWAKF